MSINKTIAFLIGIILFHIFLASWYVLHGTINFNTDIARDFLLLEDIVYNHNITLIGPRSGGISGVFHGPLWIYLLAPFYYLGQGNPVVVGWFWVILFIISIYIVYYVGNKLFDKWTGLLAAILYSSVTAGNVHALFNPYGAVLLFPLFYYFFFRYTEKLQKWDLIISVFILGAIIQFQMAFGVPILFLSVPYTVYLAIRNRKYTHLLYLFLILIPLSSFVLFEMRHDFLQVRSVIQYLSEPRVAEVEQMSLPTFLSIRATDMLNGSIGWVAYHTWPLTILILLSFIIASFKIKNKEYKKYLLFSYLFLGYWILTLFYRDKVWGYYYWPFLGMITVLFASLWKKIPLILFAVFLIVIYLSNINITLNTTIKNPIAKTDDSQWKFYKEAAETVYADAPSEFGYYVYTNDRFGYSARYAMNQQQRSYKDKKSFPFEKRATLYLLMSDSGTNKYTNKNDWKKYDIKITKQPIKTWKKNDVFTIEKYQLSKGEIEIESNPNLIQDLMFR